MPEVLLAALRRVQWRWRMRSWLYAAAIAGAAYGAVVVVSHSVAIALAVAAAGAVASLLLSRSMSLVDAAVAIESSGGSLENLIVTAAELEMQPRPVRPEFLDAIKAQAADRIRGVNVAAVVPLLQPALVAIAVAAASVAVTRTSPPLSPAMPSGDKGPGIFSISVRVSPPAYTHRTAEEFADPSQITAIAGSRIRIAASPDDRVIREFVATESTGLEINPGRLSPKFLSVVVIPDAPASVRIASPGKDTAFANAKGQVAIGIESRDDLGLAALSLKLTKASGGGENVKFTETEVPVRIDRRSDQQWDGRATIALETLGLGDGDMIVYRAVARDTNPNGVPVQSEPFVIEIGKNASIADAGFALPAEERKYAISQQMVIYKTEQLIEKKLSGEARLDESRGIAVEQRMVRAEVVFLGGGEVEDEVEEAANSNELTEGRLQNTGRVEMLRAINAMSRAEAQLNEGRLQEGLVFEKQALASLERALDRRRFFLRTLPDRSRIDATRRLTGDRRDAASWTRDPAGGVVSASLDDHRRLIRDLVTVDDTEAAALAVRLTALDPASQQLRQAAFSLAAAATESARRDAAQSAMQAVTAHAMQILPGSSFISLPKSPLLGWSSDDQSPKPPVVVRRPRSGKAEK